MAAGKGVGGWGGHHPVQHCHLIVRLCTAVPGGMGRGSLSPGERCCLQAHTHAERTRQQLMLTQPRDTAS